MSIDAGRLLDSIRGSLPDVLPPIESVGHEAGPLRFNIEWPNGCNDIVCEDGAKALIGWHLLLHLLSRPAGDQTIGWLWHDRGPRGWIAMPPNHLKDPDFDDERWFGNGEDAELFALCYALDIKVDSR